MSSEEAVVVAAAPDTVPESVLKKRKRDDQWSLSRKQKAEELKSKSAANRKVVFRRPEQFIKEYRQQEEDLVRLKKDQKLKRGIHIDPEAKLLFVVRTGGINNMHPKTWKILQLLRLRKPYNGVFVKVDKSTTSMLRKVEPYVSYGCPSIKSIRELIYKRGFGKVNKQRIALTDNAVIEEALGKFGIICIEDLVHEIYSVGTHFKEANNFLWPFKLSAPSGGLKKKSNHSVGSRDAGNHENDVNTLIRMIN